MSIIVEHEKRRVEILENSLAVFMDDGFEGATFQRIADRCGITRTTLYIYFKNKREIFNYSIKQLLLTAEKSILEIRAQKSKSSVEKITMVILDVLDLLEQNQKLLSVILDYLLHISKNDANPEMRIRRRTLRLRHILSSMVIEGIKTGELKKINIKTVDDYLYSIIEAAIFHLVVLKRKDIKELRATAVFAVKQFAA